MRLRIVILSLALATALCAGLSRIGRAETPDSGIFGVVPYQAQRVRTEQEYVEELRRELATRPDQDPKELRRLIDQREEQLTEMKDRCVQAFDPKSELPAAYAGGGVGTTGFGSCVDGKRFPHVYADGGVSRQPTIQGCEGESERPMLSAGRNSEGGAGGTRESLHRSISGRKRIHGGVCRMPNW